MDLATAMADSVYVEDCKLNYNFERFLNYY